MEMTEVEAEQKAVAEEEHGPAARLVQLGGIGLAFATVLGNEVFFRDCRNRREVGGYLGLAPSPWQSGRVRRDQGVCLAAGVSGGLKSHSVRGPGPISEGGGNASPARVDGRYGEASEARRRKPGHG